MKTSEEYLTNPNECPNCSSGNISAVGDHEMDSGLSWQQVECHDCGGIWTDMYKLIGYEDFQKGDK